VCPKAEPTKYGITFGCRRNIFRADPRLFLLLPGVAGQRGENVSTRKGPLATVSWTLPRDALGVESFSMRGAIKLTGAHAFTWVFHLGRFLTTLRFRHLPSPWKPARPMSENSNPVNDFAGAKVMITGGLGFIGSTLAMRLADQGAEVIIIDSLVPEYGGNIANIAGFESRLRVNIADLRDRHALRALIPGQDLIFNLAGQLSHLQSMTDPFTDLDINVAAQLGLLETCRQLNPRARILFASTRQIYGRPLRLPVDETHPLHPVDINGIHKMAGEAYHTLYCQIYGLPIVSLRLTNVFGPRMRIRDARQTFLGIWLRCALEGQCFEVWGGEQKRDLAFVDDVVDAFLAAARTPAAIGQVFNVGGPPPVALIELAEMITGMIDGARFERKTFPDDRKRIDIGDYYTDDSRFRAATGWMPKVSLADGLRRSFDYYRTRLSAYL
jgi:UDP-glucose 4-epimerase